jgi:chromosome segregation ATPase
MTAAKRGVLSAAAIGLIAIGISWRPTAAQSTRTDDVLPALLTEVKGLRAAMEQMASSNAQAQLLVGRLQLQEGRINGMIRRLDTVRDSLAGAKRTYEQIRGPLQMLGDKSDGADQQERESIMGGLKAQLDGAKMEVNRLTAEEAQLTSDVNAEQARWIEINQRLDTLERSLAKR